MSQNIENQPPHLSDAEQFGQSYIDLISNEPLSDVDALSLSELEEMVVAEPNLDLNPPSYLDEVPIEDVGAKSKLEEFIVNSIKALKYKNIKDEEITLATPIPKYEITKIIGEFNHIHASANDNFGHRVITKENGYFFKETDSIPDFLRNIGVPDDRIDALSSKLKLSFIGRVKSKNLGFKSFGITAINPDDPECLNAVREVVDYKSILVDSVLEKSTNLEEAISVLASNKDNILSLDNKGINEVNGVTFMDQQGISQLIKTVDGLLDKVRIEKIETPDNLVTYKDKSIKLDSYFEANLSYYTVIPKNDSDREFIESELRQLLKDHNGPIYKTPESAFSNPIKTNDESNDNVKPGSPQISTDSTNGFDKSKAPNKPKYQNKDAEIDISDEDKTKDKKDEGKKRAPDIKKPVVEQAAEGLFDMVADIAKNALKFSALMLVALMALISKVANAITLGAFEKIMPLSKVLNKDDVIRMFEPTQTVKKVAENDSTIEQNKADIHASLEKEFNSDLTIDSEIKKLGITSLSEADLVKDKLANLGDDEKNIIEMEALEAIKDLDKDEINSLLNDIPFYSEHSFDENIKLKLADKTLYDPTFGVLLGKGDLVSLNGSELGVVSAYNVGGALFYGLARENDLGQYSIEYAAAKDLSLLGHNLIKFDNYEYLKIQADENIYSSPDISSDLITSIEILDHLNPTLGLDRSQILDLSNATLIEKLDVSDEKLNIAEMVMSSDEFKRDQILALPQLHSSLTSSPEVVNDGEFHPYFGVLLAKNDEIKANLNGREINGVVIGAKVLNDNLHYIFADQNMVYTSPAQDITLVNSNQNKLSPNEISDLIQDFKFKGDFLELKYRSEITNTITSTVAHPNNSSIHYGKSNIGIDQVITDSELKPKIVEYSSNYQNASFLTIGETISQNGERRLIAIEVENKDGEYKALNSIENRIVSLHPDDAHIKTILDNIQDVSLINAQKQALDVYTVGSLKKTAALIAEHAPTILDSSEVAQKCQNIAKHAFKTLALMSAVSNLPAETISYSTLGQNLQHTIGTQANLAHSTFDNLAVVDAIKNPISHSLVSSRIEADTPSSILDHQQFGNDISDLIDQEVALQDVKQSALDLANYPPVDNVEEFSQLNDQNNYLDEPINGFIDNSVTHLEPPAHINDEEYIASVMNDYPLDQSEILDDHAIGDLSHFEQSDYHVGDTTNMVAEAAEKSTIHKEPVDTVADATVESVNQVESSNDIPEIKNGYDWNINDGTIERLNKVWVNVPYQEAVMIRSLTGYLSGENKEWSEYSALDLIDDKNILAQRKSDISYNLNCILGNLPDEIKRHQGIPDLMGASPELIESFRKSVIEDPTLSLMTESLISDINDYHDLLNAHTESLKDHIAAIAAKEEYGNHLLAYEDIKTLRNLTMTSVNSQYTDCRIFKGFAEVASEIITHGKEIGIEDIQKRAFESIKSINADQTLHAINSSYEFKAPENRRSEPELSNRGPQ